MKTIRVNIAPDGETRVATEGYQGEACLAASRPYEAALGLADTDQLTLEAFSREAEAETNRE